MPTPAFNLEDLPTGLVMRLVYPIDNTTINPTVVAQWGADSVGPYKQNSDGTTTFRTELPVGIYGASAPVGDTREGMYLTGGSLVSGSVRTATYTATPRGILNSEKSNPPVNYSTSNFKEHSKGAFIVVDETWLVKSLQDDFVSTTATDTTLIANGAVNAGKVVDIDSTGKVFQGLSSGKYYGVSSTTVANGGAPTIYLPGNIITGITVPGNIGDYVYAESDGDLSATSTGNTLVGEKRSSTSMFILTPTNVATLSQSDVEDYTSTTTGLVSGQRLYQSFEKNKRNSPLIVNVTAREALVDCNPVCLISSLTFAQSQVDGIFVGDSSNNTKVSLAPIFANGTAITTLKLSLKKTGTPVDNFQVRLETDDGTGKPTGTLVHANASASIAGGSVTTSYVDTTFTFTSFTPSINTRMHLVVQRSGAVSGGSYFIVGNSTGGSYNTTQGALHNGTSWALNSTNLCYISCSGIYTDGVYKLLDGTYTFQDIAFFGFSTGTFSAGSTAQIAISGYKSGFSSLVAGGKYKIASGVPSRTLGSGDNNQIVLRAISSTEGIILQDFRN